MKQTYSILLAEPSLLLREKIAAVLARDDRVWSVTQVDGRLGLTRGVASLHPDLILADLALLKHNRTLEAIKDASRESLIFALVDSEAEPYADAARRLGLDGVLEKGRVPEGMRSCMSKLAEREEETHGDVD